MMAKFSKFSLVRREDAGESSLFFRKIFKATLVLKE